MNFRSELRRFLLRWRLGAMLSGLLRAAFIAAVALLLAGVFDYYAGFGDRARFVLYYALTAVAGLGAVWALWDAITFMKRDAARQADAAAGSGRRDILSALELATPAGAETPLACWLRERSVAGAAEQLRALPASRSLPRRALGRNLGRLVTIAAVVGLIALVLPQPFQIIAARLLNPQADIPPYSPLHFTLGPQPAEVVYGGEFVVTAEIAGGKLDASVRCLIRDTATQRVEESPAFQENPRRFARKLEKVTAAVEVAFAVGRARSRWMPVNVRLQPKLQNVILTVEPPTYSGQPRREFPLGSQDLAALPGSRITARITSNRPLADGRLEIKGSQPLQEAVAEREDTHRVRFSWIARGAARLTFSVRDVTGTQSEPLIAEQKLLPDERPEVVLHQPSGEVLATPDTELPLEASAGDDFGLTRVALVRKLTGYRERAQSEAVQTGIRKHGVSGRVNLAAFGVLPGQTIELTLEAADTNPNLLGVSVSESAKIHIITREDYAAMLRSQTSLQEFADRYAALADAMQDAREALKELEAAAKTGDDKKAEEARKKAFDAHERAAKIFGQIAKDFPIFDSDSGLGEAAKDVAGRLLENGKQLDELANAPAADMAAAVSELKKRLGEAEQRAEPEMKKGERIVAAAKAVEQIGKFKELIESQRELVKDFNRASEQIRRGEAQAGSALADLAKRQKENAEKLRGVEKELGAALDALPEEFEAFTEEGREFLNLLKEAGVPPVMDDAAKAAEGADSRVATEKANDALQRLEELLKKENGVCEACRGGGQKPKFPWPQDLDSTIQQLMQQLIPQPSGKGEGKGKKPGAEGEGGGASGDSEHGFSMEGKMPRLPMYGPPRSRFDQRAGPQLGGTGKAGDGKGKGAPGSGADITDNALPSQTSRKSTGEGAASEAVPEAYRNAVKRFFSNEPGAGAPQSNKP